jgi:hypothetical protein
MLPDHPGNDFPEEDVAEVDKVQVAHRPADVDKSQQGREHQTSGTSQAK